MTVQHAAIGLDLSLTGTGWAICRPERGGHRVIRSTGSRDDTLAQRMKRLNRLATDIRDACTGDFALVAVEGPSYNSFGGSSHDRSGLWWLVVTYLRDAGLDIVEIPPKSVKKYATGNGAADKRAMHAAALRRLPWVADNATADEVDASWLSVMVADHLGLLDEPVVPQAQQAALEQVRWPELLERP